MHVNNTVHVFFQVSQDAAKTYMQASLNFTLEDTKIMEEEPHTVCCSTLCAVSSAANILIVERTSTAVKLH